MGWSVIARALTHRSPFIRVLFAIAIGSVFFAGAWTMAYAVLPEGATRFSLGFAPALDARANAGAVAATVFLWNSLLGFGVIVIASAYSVGPISLGYLAPWTWLIRFGLALGTNSFVLVVPGARAMPLDPAVLLTHAGVREMVAYFIVAAVLAKATLWRQRRLTDRRLVRVRHLRDLRFTLPEVALLASGFFILAWSAVVEAGQIAALQKL